MAALRERYDPLRLMGRRLLIALLGVLVISVLWGVWNIYRKNVEASQLRAQAQGQLADLQGRQTKLQADYDKLKTDRGMEEALRQQYAVGAAGEGLIVIVEPQTPKPLHATSSIMQWIKNVFSHF
jgi:cell division protein FtsB